MLRVYALLQILIGHSKRQAMACITKFLGMATDFSRMLTDTALVIGPWPMS